MSKLVEIIVASDSALRNTPLERVCDAASLAELLAECEELEKFRRNSRNLYERVRALFFLYAIHRFHLPSKPGLKRKGLVSFDGYEHLLKRRFEEAIGVFLNQQQLTG